MKIFVSHSSSINYQDELYVLIKESVLSDEHEFFLPHEDKKLGDTKEIIKNSDLVLAEVSFPSIGQGIELGWANMLNIPIFCISKENTNISGSLKFITDKFFTYQNREDFIAKISNFLASYSK